MIMISISQDQRPLAHLSCLQSGHANCHGMQYLVSIDGQTHGRVLREVSHTMPLTGEYEPSTSDWARQQVELYEASGGLKGTTMRDMPVIVLTSIGAKSGKLRKTALMRVEHDGEYGVVASLGGAPNNPVWYYNLKKNPHVELQDGPVKHDYQAREVTGDEKAEWWKRAVAAYPDYADYQTKTDRQIPLFVLTAIDSE